MPTYEYECQKCGHTMDVFQSITANPLRKCPECKKMSLKRLIGPGAGIIFKGSGFYETDYKRSRTGTGSSSSKSSKPDESSGSDASTSSSDTKSSSSDTKSSDAGKKSD